MLYCCEQCHFYVAWYCPFLPDHRLCIQHRLHCVLQTEFTSLHQWQREYLIFEQLHGKLHFMHFRLWKQFALWRRAVRVRKTAEAR